MKEKNIFYRIENEDIAEFSILLHVHRSLYPRPIKQICFYN